MKRKINFGKNKKSNIPQNKLDRPDFTKQDNVVDYLSEDDEIKGQKFVCLSFCSLKDKQKEEAIQNICKENGFNYTEAKVIIDRWSEYSEPKRAIKVRGTYPTYEKALERSNKLRRIHKNHHVFVGEVGFWGPFDPDASKITNQNYMEKQLNELKEGYERNLLMTKEHFEQRTHDLARKARLEGTKWGQEYLMKKSEPLEAVQERVKLANEQIAQYEEKIAEAKKAQELAIKKLEYLNQHPELIEQAEPDDIEEVAPEDVKKEVTKGTDKTVLQDLETMKKIDDARNRIQTVQMPQNNENDEYAQAIQEIIEDNVNDDDEDRDDIPQLPPSTSVEHGETFADDLLLPHQQRENIKKFDEEYRKANPNPLAKDEDTRVTKTL